MSHGGTGMGMMSSDLKNFCPQIRSYLPLCLSLYVIKAKITELKKSILNLKFYI